MILIQVDSRSPVAHALDASGAIELRVGPSKFKLFKHSKGTQGDDLEFLLDEKPPEEKAATTAEADRRFGQPHHGHPSAKSDADEEC